MLDLTPGATLIGFAETVAASSQAGKSRNLHRSPPQTRRIVHGRFAYASRHPKTFTI
jgi:hypothetical protein